MSRTPFSGEKVLEREPKLACEKPFRNLRSQQRVILVGVFLLLLGCDSSNSIHPDHSSFDSQSETDGLHRQCPDPTVPCAACDDSLFCTQDFFVSGECVHNRLPHFCLIDGVCVPGSAGAPNSYCQACLPSLSDSAWSVLPDGSQCVGSAGICSDGVCCDPTDNCAGKECGSDGCGGSCGMCLPHEVCEGGTCTCSPDCESRNCGPDGCLGSCGSCELPGDVCLEGQCICIPSCDSAYCGSDGCGGNCGQCCQDQQCLNGHCVWPAKECDDGNCVDWDGCNQGSIAEFPLSSMSNMWHREAEVASVGDGYWVTWTAPGWGFLNPRQYDLDSVVARQYDSNWNPAGQEFLVSPLSVVGHWNPHIGAGSWGTAIAWISSAWVGEEDDLWADGANVYVRAYNVEGEAQSNVVVVGNPMPSPQALSVFSTGDDSFAVAWSGTENPTWAPGAAESGVWIQEFNISGDSLGARFHLNQSATTEFAGMWSTAVEKVSDLGVVAVWGGWEAGEPKMRLEGCMADLEFQVCAPFMIDEGTHESGFGPSLAATGDGGFLVAWPERITDTDPGDIKDVYVRRFNAAAEAISPPMLVNTSSTAAYQGPWAHPPVLADCFSNTECIVTWSGAGAVDGFGVYARLMDFADLDSSSDFLVNAFTYGLQQVNDLHVVAPGSVLVVWSVTYGGGTGPEGGVWAQRFSSAGTKLYH